MECSPAHQLCKGAPWVIRAPVLESAAVRDEAQSWRRCKPRLKIPVNEPLYPQ